VLAALIMKGEVANNKRQLFEATNMLRGLWAQHSAASKQWRTGVTWSPAPTLDPPLSAFF